MLNTYVIGSKRKLRKKRPSAMNVIRRVAYRFILRTKNEDIPTSTIVNKFHIIHSTILRFALFVPENEQSPIAITDLLMSC
jgi:hypothetical protein